MGTTFYKRVKIRRKRRKRRKKIVKETKRSEEMHANFAGLELYVYTS